MIHDNYADPQWRIPATPAIHSLSFWLSKISNWTHLCGSPISEFKDRWIQEETIGDLLGVLMVPNVWLSYANIYMYIQLCIYNSRENVFGRPNAFAD